MYLIKERFNLLALLGGDGDAGNLSDQLVILIDNPYLGKPGFPAALDYPALRRQPIADFGAGDKINVEGLRRRWDKPSSWRPLRTPGPQPT